jgi:2-octaprenyl-6-methoxyphenol hydroxylase
LAEKLSALFSKPEDQKTLVSIEATLKDYADSRKLDRSATIGLTDFMARIFTSNLLPVVIGRGLALSALQWLPPAKTALARQMMFGRR